MRCFLTFHVNFIESLKFTTISKLSKTFLEFTKQVFQNFTFILCHNNLWGPSTNSDSLYIPPKVKSPQILLLIYFPRHVTELPQKKPLRFAPENNFQICPRENIFPKDRHFNACLWLNNTKTLSTWMFCISFIHSPFPTTILKLCTHERKLQTLKFTELSKCGYFVYILDRVLILQSITLKVFPENLYSSTSSTRDCFRSSSPFQNLKLMVQNNHKTEASFCHFRFL